MPRHPEELDGALEAERVAALEQLYAALPTLACKGLCQHSCAEHVEASDLEHARAHAAGVDLTTPTPTDACPALRTAFGAGHCAIHPVRPMVCRLWGIAASMPCPHGCLPELTGWPTSGDLEYPDNRGGHESAHPRENDVDDAHDEAPLAGLTSPSRGVRPLGAPSAGASGTTGTTGTGSSGGRHLPDADALRAMLAVLRLGGHEAAAPGMAQLLEACVDDGLAAALVARLMRGDASVKPALGARLQQLRTKTPSNHPARPASAAGPVLPRPPTRSGDDEARAS